MASNRNDMADLSSFPPEIILQILRFLAPEDILELAKVSRLFAAITNDRTLWRERTKLHFDSPTFWSLSSDSPQEGREAFLAFYKKSYKKLTPSQKRFVSAVKERSLTNTTIEPDHIRATNHLENTPLCVALKYNDPNIASLLIKNGAQLRHGWDMLGLKKSDVKRAVKENHLNALQACFQAQLKPDIYQSVATDDQAALAIYIRSVRNLRETDDHGYSALHYAAMFGHTRAVEKLLTANAELIEFTDSDGYAPLHLAARFGHINVVDCLLRHGANIHVLVSDVDIQDPITPLHEACKMGQVQMVEYLLACGALIEGIQPCKYTPLDAAIQGSHSPVVKKLLEKGAAFDARSSDQEYTPLYDVFSQFRDKEDQVKITQYLLEAGANPNAILEPSIYSPHSYKSPLLFFLGNCAFHRFEATRNTKKIVELLLAHDANVHTTTTDGSNALHSAAQLNGGVGLMKLLIDKGISVDVANREGKTPLHMAADVGNLENIKFLLENRANFNSCDAKGLTPLQTFITSFASTSTENELNVLKCFIEHGVSLNQINAKGNTVLHAIAQATLREELMRSRVTLAVDLGAYINATNRVGETPLHLASAAKNKPLIDLLLAHEADPTFLDYSGRKAYVREPVSTSTTGIFSRPVASAAAKANPLAPSSKQGPR